jgi:hypothetical protein
MLIMTILTFKQLIQTGTLLLAVILLPSCSSIKTTPQSMPQARPKITSTFQNFDRKGYPKEAYVVSNMIAVVQPELDEENRDTIASQISLAIKKYSIPPQVMVAIIDTESNFRAEKVSTTGDVSIAQINVEVWNKEFIRMKRPALNKEKIKMDQQYALMKMAEILNIIKKRYAKKDRRWYARYHSNTHKYKREYLHKLEIRMKMLSKSSDLTIRIAQNN